MNVMRRRSVIISLVMVLLIGAYPGVFGFGGGKVYAADDFAGGSGTLVDPYWISTAEQLDEMRNYLDSHFILINDIDMSVFDAGSPWEPIGDETTAFTGSLDGQNHKIYNLSIHLLAAAEPVGLFSVIGTTSTIKNLTIEAIQVTGQDHVGLLAGKNQAALHNVGVTGSVYGREYVGGLAGLQVASNVTNSFATGSVNGLSNVGGLFGFNDSATISHSYAAADVKGLDDQVGGLVGKQINGALITNSYATGNVTGCEDTGGLVGENEDSHVVNSFTTGMVTGLCGVSGAGDSIGGLVGDNSDGWVTTSYVTGQVTNGSPIGAVTGYSNPGRVTNSYYNLETTGESDVDALGLTTEEMKDWRNYIGWDFDNDWDIHSLVLNGYPYVKDIQFYLTYIGNGTDHSSEQHSIQSYKPGTSVEIQDIPHDWTKADYQFHAWNTEADGSGDTYRPHETILMNSDVQLYAVWTLLNPPAPPPPSSTPTVNQQSDNADLAQLIVKAGEDELVLTPEFSADTTEYQVETTADEVTIEAVASDWNAAVTLDTETLAGEQTVTLMDGVNAFEITVKAESGKLQTYDLTIHRLVIPVEPDTQACAFQDTEGHWAEQLICEALGIGIVEGYSESSFQPQAYITRVEFVAILLRVLGISSGSAESGRSFIDHEQIPGWGRTSVSAAVEHGILQGYPDRTIRPMQHVSRSEMVVMLAKAMKWEREQGDTAFADDTDIPSWAKGYVNGAVQKNLIYGREGNRFSPSDPATRAEATALLLRLWYANNNNSDQ